MTFRTSTLSHLLPLALAIGTGWATAAADTPTVSGKSMPGAVAPSSRSVIKSTTLPASGLFEGDRLSPSTKARIDALLANATDLDIEVALLVPSGPWKIDGKSVDEQNLTPARLTALRQHLAQRGLPSKRIYVESRIDRTATEPKLVIELVGTPAPQ